MHTYGAGWEQNFRRHPDANGDEVSGIYVRSADLNSAFWVPPEFWTVWMDGGGESGIGYPTDEKTASCPASAPPNCSAYQQFERGYIWTGSSGASIVQRPTLLTITNTTATTPYMYLNSGASAWVNTGDTSQGNGPNRLRYFGGGLVFHMTVDNSVDGRGSLRRSKDYGNTWTTLSAPSGSDQIIDLDRAPNGDLWALWADNSCCTPYRLKIYESSDDGDSWSMKLDAGAASGFSIAVNPADGNYIAFTQRSSTKLQARVSSDGGSSWTSAQQVSNNLSASSKGLEWTGSTRLVVQSQATGHIAIYTSDSSPWNSWTTRMDLSFNDEWKQMVASGDLLFALRHGVGDAVMLHRSTDGGMTWEGIKKINYGQSGQVDFARGLAYDTENDVVYVAYQSLNTPANAARLADASTVAAATAHEGWQVLANPPGDINRDQLIVVITDVP